MTIVVLFQLIFLNIRRKFIVFRDLSPNRPFQELNNIQLLTAHYLRNFHSLQKRKFGLRPIEPSSCSSVAPRSLLSGPSPPSWLHLNEPSHGGHPRCPRRAQLDQLRHSEKPKSWSWRLGAPPPWSLMEMVVRSLSKIPLCRLC